MVSNKNLGAGIILGIIIGIISWSLYGLIHQGIKDGLGLLGITNIYAVFGLTLLIGIVILFLAGFGLIKIVRKIIG